MGEIEIDQTRLKELVDAVKRKDDCNKTQMWRIFFDDYGKSDYTPDEEDDDGKNTRWWDTSSEEFPSQESAKRKWWDDLTSKSREDYRRHILHYKFTRKIKVYKDVPETKMLEDGKEDCKEERKWKFRVHREYEKDDTVLNEILRNMKCAKRKVLKNRFGEISRSYLASRTLYRIVRQTTRSDDTWETFMRECCKLKREPDGKYRLTTEEEYGYGLTNKGDDSKRVDYVFCIPHTTGDRKNRDDSILSLAARKNPPLKVVQTILGFCREAISYVDDPEWDSIPLNYAIRYGASPEVVEALIPTKEDIKSFKSLGDFDFLNNRGVHYRTFLHWAAYHDASIETIRVLKKHCKEHVLDKLDHCQLTPMETAIWHGRSTDKIKEFFFPGLKGNDVFEDVLAKLIRSMIYDENPFGYSSKYDPLSETLCDNLCETFADDPVNPDVTRKLSSKDDTYGDKGDKYPLEMEEAICPMDYHMPSISRSIARSKNLQTIVSDRMSCRLPTAVKLADLYACVALIVSYKLCTKHVFDTGDDITSTPMAYLLIASVLFMSAREFIELMIDNANWFLSIWNYLDFFTICLVWHSYRIMCDINPNDMEYGMEFRDRFGLLTIITTACIWVNTIVIFRSTYMPFAILVTGTFRILRRLIPFIIWSTSILIAFGQIFSLHSLVKNRCESDSTLVAEMEDAESSVQPDFCSFRNYTLTTYDLFIGNMGYENLVESTTISIFFWIVAILVLQNIVIAIVTKAWDEIVDVSKEVFWDHRLSFLMSVKGYERFYSCCSKHYSSSSDKYSKNSGKSYDEDHQDRLSEWLRCLWPGNRYIGLYETMTDRIFSNGVGSLRWQIVYQCRDSTKRKKYNRFLLFKKRCVAMTKASLLLILVFIVVVVLFILGWVTLGLLWPKRIREFIIGRGSEADEDKSGPKADRDESRPKVHEDKSTSEVKEKSSWSDVNKEESNSELEVEIMKLLHKHSGQKQSPLS